jgi:predicted secreted protein
MAGEHHFTERDSGATADILVGETFSVELAENPTTGHRWTEPGLDGRSVAAESDEFEGGAKEAAGRGGMRRFTFRMQSVGATTIRLAYRRSWEAAGDAARQFELTVIGRS